MSHDDFEEFLVEHLPWLLRLSWALAVRSGGDHHTLLSGTVMTLHRRWPTIQPPVVATRRAFASTVMVHLAQSEKRRAHVRCEAPTADLQALLDRTLRPGWDDDPAFAVVRKERELEVYRAIRELPPEERAIMMLIVQGFSWRETADALGTAVAEVRNGVLRARRRLRELREEP